MEIKLGLYHRSRAYVHADVNASALLELVDLATAGKWAEAFRRYAEPTYRVFADPMRKPRLNEHRRSKFLQLVSTLPQYQPGWPRTPRI